MVFHFRHFCQRNPLVRAENLYPVRRVFCDWEQTRL